IRVDGRLRAPVRGGHVVECRPPDDMAQGRVPWGGGAPLSRPHPTTTGQTISGAPVGTAPPQPPPVGVGPNARRHRWQLELVCGLAAARPDLITVEMGWPGPDPLPGSVVVRTFGASRVSGEAVAELLVAGSDV